MHFWTELRGVKRIYARVKITVFRGIYKIDNFYLNCWIEAYQVNFSPFSRFKLNPPPPDVQYSVPPYIDTFLLYQCRKTFEYFGCNFKCWWIIWRRTHALSRTDCQGSAIVREVHHKSKALKHTGDRILKTFVEKHITTRPISVLLAKKVYHETMQSMFKILPLQNKSANFNNT